ncbi:MAG: peptidyl-prolyl cis-trans isomerase [Candidatus Coatesbacteria bacterium]|nr:MAG: peptidyl-prolyl cis-trans isomerase [Candidatus Coatesbacteria bacterium]
MKRTVLLTSVVAVIVVGCGPVLEEETAIAYIDGEPAVLANLYSRAYENIVKEENEGKPLPYERARELLDDVVTADVLVREAEAAGYAGDGGFAEEVRSFSERALLTALDEWAAGQVEVAEEEIRLMYDINENQRLYSVIYGYRRDRVEEAKEKLDAGEPFEDVAAEYSADPAAEETGGKSEIPLPYNGDVFTEALYGLADIGDVTDVLTNEVKSVFVVLRYDGHADDEGSESEDGVLPESKSYDEMADVYERQIRARKTGEFMNAELDAFIENSAPVYNDELYDAVFTTAYEELSERYSEDDAVLASVAGVDFMFNEFYGVLPMYLRMGPEDIDEYRQEQPEYFRETADAALRWLLRGEVRSAFAKNLELDRTPDFELERYRKKGDLLVSDFYEGVFVPSVFDPTEEELRAYYEGHKEEFGNPEKMKVAYVAAYDEAKVNAWRDLVASGGDFRTEVYEKWGDYLNEASEEEMGTRDPRDSINAGTYIYKDPDRKPVIISVNADILDLLEKEVYNYGAGDTSPVIPTEDGRYLFFYNAEYVPYSDKPYEDVTDEVLLGYQNEVMGNPTTDEKLQGWFAELRAKHEIEVDEAVFKKLYKRLSAGEWEDEQSGG